MTRITLAATALGLLVIAAVAPATVRAQSAPPPLHERMSRADFHAAGLDKLTPDELAHLDTWLRQHPAVTTAQSGQAAPAPEPAGTPLRKPHRTAVTRRVDGVLHGWSGKTVFHLENGQIWRQRGTDSWSAGKSLDHPKATIKPAAFGSWLLKIDGYNATTRVERVR